MPNLNQIQELLSRQSKASPLNLLKDEGAIQDSIRYLSSEEARQSLDADPYWPKWNSPWWHMSLLHEMGLAERIPQTAVRWMVAAIQRQYVPHFFAHEVPTGRDPVRKTFCHCGLGNIYQFLSAAGANLDQVLPYARSWFQRYQMPDGGLNCDEDAYKAETPASSIVGTIAPLEAVLLFTKHPFTSEQEAFLDAGARCLIERKLMLGCSAPQNEDEKKDEADWIKLCFPRFYLYDVLRGLTFILRWAEIRKKSLPADAIAGAIAILCEKFPDGQIHVERHAFESVGSRIQTSSGEWTRSETASSFPLLVQVSELGQISPYLTVQWNDAKGRSNG